jgi:hypothetical protein
LLKRLYLGVRNIRAGIHKPGNRGNGTWHWTAALDAFEINFPGRPRLS